MLGFGVALLTGCTPTSDSGTTPAVTLTALRDYGYVLGDTIDHTLSIELTDGQTLDPTALPQPGPVNEWLILRESRQGTQQVDGHAVEQVHVTYQIFKGVRVPEPVVIPPLTLRLTGHPPREIHAPAWTFTLAPVIPPEITDEQVELRDPVPVTPAPTTLLLRQLLLWLAGSAGVGLLFGLRRLLRHRRTRPFAQATRPLKAALGSRPEADALRDGLKILHRAFDQTFGETLFAGQIERFCAEHPTFAPIKDRLAAFFVLSQNLFFDLGGSIHPDPATRDWLVDLGRRCSAAERKAL